LVSTLFGARLYIEVVHTADRKFILYVTIQSAKGAEYIQACRVYTNDAKGQLAGVFSSLLKGVLSEWLTAESVPETF
jgi:hypothetical protein